MKTGILKWFDKDNGLGMVRPDDGSEDSFLALSELDELCSEVLSEGMKVLFEHRPGPKGPRVSLIQKH